MEVYIEYAFLENFALDFSLVYLAYKLSRTPTKFGRLSLSACVGAIFAIIYPFFSATPFLNGIVTIGKVTFPFLACWLGAGYGIRKKDRGRYLLSVVCYYALSFAFAGGVYAFCNLFGIEYAVGNGIYIGVPIGTIFAGGVVVGVGVVALTKAIYKKRALARFIYPCELVIGDRRVRSEGYLDSGNLAKKGETPICFVNAEVFFDLFGARAFECGDAELLISTVAGEKKIKLFLLDELRIYLGKQKNIVNKPYCAISPALQGKEYGVLFGAWAVGFVNSGDER